MAPTKSKTQKTPTTLPPAKTRAKYTKYYNAGAKLYKRGMFGEALIYLTAAWNYDGTGNNIMVMIADCLFNQGMKNKALELLTHALIHDDQNADICSVLGSAALNMHFYDLAEKCYAKYVDLMPSDPVGYNNFASALRENNKYDAAISLLQDILPLFPENDALWNTLGGVVDYRDGPAAALVFYEEALRLNPTNIQVLNNIPKVYSSLGQGDKAKAALEKCISLTSDFPSPHLLLSDLYFSEGNLEKGWEEYEWRKHKRYASACIMPYDVPHWKPGESLKGKTLLIGAEQGVGDEFLASCLYKEVIEEAGHVIIGCNPRLIPLFQNSFPEATITPFQLLQHKDTGYNLKAYPEIDIETVDLLCFNMDVARNKWRKVEDIKAYDQILSPTAEKIDYWHHKLSELPEKLNVGITWRSGLMHASRLKNYATLLEWAPLLSLDKINFINLQYGDTAAERAELKEKTGIELHHFEELDLKDDFDSTSALMSTLDLVLGPTSTPVVQAACAGAEAWWLKSGHIWWTYGEDRPPWLTKSRVLEKNPNEKWASFMNKAADEVAKWVKNAPS